ncbi:MAG: host-nuclease inhibitor Gam family protein [Magnetococcales bacterium]|nr:host-nuclease inhibitor Gam family protein [Magnetococcales bacterium]
MAVSKRNKPDNLVAVRDLQEANTVLGEIAQLKRSIDAIEADMNDTIDRIKRSAEAFSAPRRARLDALTNGLLAFAEFNKESLFTKKRALELSFGMLGFRRSSELKPQGRGTWAQVLDKIKALGMAEALRVREEVNRETLRAWPEERLGVLGVRRVEKDLFWYELKMESLDHLVDIKGGTLSATSREEVGS